MPNKTLQQILYAEDESDIREIAQISLEEIGQFTVTYCTDGRDALEKARTLIPDLILLDVMMPDLDGPSTLQALRKLAHYETIPAIFMTAKIQPDEIAKYKEMGAIDVITKPFDPMTLADKLQMIWSRYQESCTLIK